nr:MAG TPA: hypothetical protein [Bacteriophage sp.]
MKFFNYFLHTTLNVLIRPFIPQNKRVNTDNFCNVHSNFYYLYRNRNPSYLIPMFIVY